MLKGYFILSFCIRKVFNNDLLSRQFLLAYPNFTVRFVLFTENLLQS